MKKLSKRMKMMKNSINSSKPYDILQGLELLKKTTQIHFVESVDVAINLGIDARKSDQNIRSYAIMPHGLGKSIKVAVFTQGDNLKLAKSSGADLVGLEDLFVKIKQKSCKLDVIIASPDVMHIVSQLGPILGPKGLMPNPKMGTVSQNIKESVQNAKSGQIQYRNDKNGIIHAMIGKINLDSIKLKENLEALITSIQQSKPTQCKGTYIKKITISTSMGKSIIINQDSLFNIINKY